MYQGFLMLGLDTTVLKYLMVWGPGGGKVWRAGPVKWCQSGQDRIKYVKVDGFTLVYQDGRCKPDTVVQEGHYLGHARCTAKCLPGWHTQDICTEMCLQRGHTD